MQARVSPGAGTPGGKGIRARPPAVPRYAQGSLLFGLRRQRRRGMASVTIDRIDGVRRDIADAVNRTAPGSTLPEPEQERLLAQACTETCALLTDWADSPQWEDLRPERMGRCARRSRIRSSSGRCWARCSAMPSSGP